MFTDTHCHLYSEYYDDIDEIVKKAQERQINRVFNNGVDDRTNREILAMLPKYDCMYAAIGIHPEYVKDYKDDDLKFVEEHLNDDKVFALGEIGLDYHYGKENAELQKKLFHKQMVLAEKYHLPVVIHSRDATEDTIAVLKQYPNVIGDIHCFSGSIETAKIYISMGYKIAIGGVVTFKNSNLY